VTTRARTIPSTLFSVMGTAQGSPVSVAESTHQKPTLDGGAAGRGSGLPDGPHKRAVPNTEAKKAMETGGAAKPPVPGGAGLAIGRAVHTHTHAQTETSASMHQTQFLSQTQQGVGRVRVGATDATDATAPTQQFQFGTTLAARRPGGSSVSAAHILLLPVLVAIGKPCSGGRNLHRQYIVRTLQRTMLRRAGTDLFPDTGGVPRGAHTHRMGDERGWGRARNAARVPAGRLVHVGAHRGSRARPSADSHRERTGHLRFSAKMFVPDRRRTFGGNWLRADSNSGGVGGATGGGQGTGGAGHAGAHAARRKEGNKGDGGTGGRPGRAQEAKPTPHVTRVRIPI